MNRSLGPLLVGTSINAILYGIMVLQCYLYFMWYKHDKKRIKAVVLSLLLLDTVSCAFDIGMTYNYLVTNFGNPEAIQVINLYLSPYRSSSTYATMFITFVTQGITAFVVQCFYGWRIHVLTRTRILSVLIYICSTIQMLASIGATVGGTILQQFTSLVKVEQVSLIWLVGSLVTDIIISTSLVWYLQKSKTGFSGSDDLITRLNRMTIQTGVLTTSLAIAMIITFFVFLNSTIHIGIGLTLSKMYTNSLLSTLNARQGWTRSGNTNDGLSGLKATTGSSFNGRNVIDSSNTLVNQDDIEMHMPHKPHYLPSVPRASVWPANKVKILVESTSEIDTRRSLHRKVSD
ncbi:hypothetical protein ACEPAG_4795 [Sanghuangporus baumii]